MKTGVSKNQQPLPSPPSHSISSASTGSTVSFVDNRPDICQTRKCRQAMRHHPGVTALPFQLQGMRQPRRQPNYLPQTGHPAPLQCKNDDHLGPSKTIANQENKVASIQTAPVQRKKKSEAGKVGLEIETTLLVRRADQADLKLHSAQEADLQHYPENDEISRKIYILPALNVQTAAAKELLSLIYKKKEKKETIDSTAYDKPLDDFYGKGAHPEKENLRKYLAGETPTQPPRLEERFGNTLTAKYDPHLKNILYKGNGWHIVPDKTPVAGWLHSGNLLSKMCAEIVTDPVDSIEESEKIMQDIQDWVNTAVGTILANDNRAYYCNGYIYEIPDVAGLVSQCLSGNKLNGNIQVNIGATLEDVIPIFKGNLKDISVANERALITEALKQFGSDEFWEKVKDKFNLQPKKTQRQKKNRGFRLWGNSDKKYNKNADDTPDRHEEIAITPENEPYLRNIMFQYLYIGLANSKKRDGNSATKNEYPILIKTPIERQVALSQWKGKDVWLRPKQKKEIGGNALAYMDEKKRQDLATQFRKRFKDSILTVLKESETQKASKLKKSKALKELNKQPKLSNLLNNVLQEIGDATDAVNINKHNDGNEIVGEDQLAIDGGYAGVFELRYPQATTHTQSQWSKIWKHYLEMSNAPLSSLAPAKEKDKDMPEHVEKHSLEGLLGFTKNHITNVAKKPKKEG